MTDELIKHPTFPTWPTPAANILHDEADRLREVAKNLGYKESTYEPLQETLGCILKEHKKWRESVVNNHSDNDDVDMRLIPVVPYKPYGSPVSRPSKFWIIFSIIQFIVIVVYIFIKLLKV